MLFLVHIPFIAHTEHLLYHVVVTLPYLPDMFKSYIIFIAKNIATNMEKNILFKVSAQSQAIIRNINKIKQ